MLGIGTNPAGAHSSALRSGLDLAAVLTRTTDPADRIWLLRLGRIFCPFRSRPDSPISHAMQSGPLSLVTGAYTTPSIGCELRSRPTEIADPRWPRRKSVVPSFGSTTQQRSAPVSLLSVSSPQKSQSIRASRSVRRASSISTSTSALSPAPRGPSGRSHSDASIWPAESTDAMTCGRYSNSGTSLLGGDALSFKTYLYLELKLIPKDVLQLLGSEGTEPTSGLSIIWICKFIATMGAEYFP